MSLRRTKMNVENHHCYAYAENYFKITIKKNRKNTILKYHLKVSSIMVKSTNFPNSGTTSDVGGMISANSRKNTVKDSKIDIDKLT